MNNVITLILTTFLSSLPLTSFAQDYEVPRTEWDQPDLQGVWNWSSNVPMQRPSQYGERQFLTPEEVEDLLAAELPQTPAPMPPLTLRASTVLITTFGLKIRALGGT